MRAVMMVVLLGSLVAVGWCQTPGAPPAAPQPGMPQPGGPGQPGMPPGGMGMPGGGPGMMGPGMGMGMMPGMMNFPPQQFAPVMMIVDGVVYIAFDGTVTAFEAKTLKELGKGVYANQPRNRNRGGNQRPGAGAPGGGGGAAGGPVGPPAPGQ